MHIGSQIARLAVPNKYNVVINNSRGPETLSALVAKLGPRAHPATPVDAAKGSPRTAVPAHCAMVVIVDPFCGRSTPRKRAWVAS